MLRTPLDSHRRIHMRYYCRFTQQSEAPAGVDASSAKDAAQAFADAGNWTWDRSDPFTVQVVVAKATDVARAIMAEIKPELPKLSDVKADVLEALSQSDLDAVDPIQDALDDAAMKYAQVADHLSSGVGALAIIGYVGDVFDVEVSLPTAPRSSRIRR